MLEKAAQTVFLSSQYHAFYVTDIQMITEVPGLLFVSTHGCMQVLCMINKDCIRQLYRPLKLSPTSLVTFFPLAFSGQQVDGLVYYI